jgi:nicotinate-nucleotide pyrophosphorylase (carboxylating)
MSTQSKTNKGAQSFSTLFSESQKAMIRQVIVLALEEDGHDLTSGSVFAPHEIMSAEIVAKQDAVLAGLVLMETILDHASESESEAPAFSCRMQACDGNLVQRGQVLAEITASARILLAAERIIMNFLCRLSGVATTTAAFAKKLDGTGCTLLDTRKTTPGLRFLEKYAVRMGGGRNHRMGLNDMLMLKDNHIDRAGGITSAVRMVRATHGRELRLEVECRTLDDVREAAGCQGVDRIMFDNMDPETIIQALKLVPSGMETEISGGVTLDTVERLGRLGATFISCGAITASAPSVDMSMRCMTKE